MILEKISTPPVQEVEYLDETDRGNDGFGSTGIEKTEKRVQLSQFLNQMDLSKRLDRTKLFCLFCNMLKTRNYRMIDALFPKYDHVNILIAFYLYDQPEYFKKTKLSLQNTHIDFSDFDKCEDELLEFQLENSRVRFLLKNMENESLEDLIGARYRTYDLLNTEYQNLYPWDFNSSILFIRQATPIEVKSVVGKWLEVNRDEWKNIIKQFFQ